MTRDFAKNKPAPSNKHNRKKGRGQKTSAPAWVWLFTGTALGAFIMFLVYLSSLAPNSENQPLQNSDTSINKKASTPKPRFDFYQLLKESEVSIDTTPSQTTSAGPSKASDTLEYILQVGSFKSSSDADRMRVELILLNLDAQVETVTMRNGETWNRVLVGPFQSRSMMSKARGTLVSNDIVPLLLKRKPQS